MNVLSWMNRPPTMMRSPVLIVSGFLVAIKPPPPPKNGDKQGEFKIKKGRGGANLERRTTECRL